MTGYNPVMPKLVILDGNSLLYRGFFAMRALSTSDRLPTNAVYSFILMLLTILEREKPDAIFAAFDPARRHVPASGTGHLQGNAQVDAGRPQAAARAGAGGGPRLPGPRRRGGGLRGRRRVRDAGGARQALRAMKS